MEFCHVMKMTTAESGPDVGHGTQQNRFTLDPTFWPEPVVSEDNVTGLSSGAVPAVFTGGIQNDRSVNPVVN